MTRILKYSNITAYTIIANCICYVNAGNANGGNDVSVVVVVGVRC